MTCRGVADLIRSQRAALALVGLFVATWAGGCGGSDQSAGGGSATRTIHGTVAGPAGVAMVRSSLGEAPVAGGRFAIVGFEGRQLVAAESADGVPMLLGWLGDGATELSPRSLAEVLVWLATLAPMAPPELQAELQALLADAAELDPLADAIAAALAGNPDAFATDQPTVAQALADVLAALAAAGTAERGSRAAQIYVDRLGRALLINPTDAKSGLRLDTTGGLDTVTVFNAYRRLTHVSIDRVSTFDADGNETASTSHLTDFELPAVQGVSTTIGSFVDLIWGRTAYGEVSSQAVKLPNVDGAAKTRYELLVVGPGHLPGDGDRMDAQERAKQREVTQIFIARDVFLTLVLNWLIPASGVQSVLGSEAAKDATQDVVNLIGNSVPGAWDKAAGGDVSGALFDVYQALATSNSFRNALLQITLRLIAARFGKPAIEKLGDRVATLMKSMAVVDAALAGFDVSQIGNAIANAAIAEAWQVDVVRSAVRLDPEQASIEPRDIVELTVAVTDAPAGTPFEYRYSTPGSAGQIRNATQTGTQITSSQPTIIYEAGSDEGNDTVTVEVFALAGPGGADREKVGEATSMIEVKHSAVQVEPGFREVEGGQSVSLKATVDPAPAGPLRFRWTTAAAHGVLDGPLDGFPQSFENVVDNGNTNAVVYHSDPRADRVGTEEIRCEVIDQEGNTLGADSAFIEVKNEPDSQIMVEEVETFDQPSGASFRTISGLRHYVFTAVRGDVGYRQIYRYADPNEDIPSTPKDGASFTIRHGTSYRTPAEFRAEFPHSTLQLADDERVITFGIGSRRFHMNDWDQIPEFRADLEASARFWFDKIDFEVQTID